MAAALRTETRRHTVALYFLALRLTTHLVTAAAIYIWIDTMAT